MNEDTLDALLVNIKQAVLEARTKHKHLGNSLAQAIQAVKSEMLEWEAQAILVQNPDGRINATRQEKAFHESLDVIATLIRFMLCDYQGVGGKY